ncbi:hypothetical protein D3C87_931570 [compost metagenome]
MRTDFKQGDIIIYCDEEFVVLKNHGDRGRVKENYDDGFVIDPFYWEYDGERCFLKRKLDFLD